MTPGLPAEDRSVEWHAGGFVYYTASAGGAQYERIYASMAAARKACCTGSELLATQNVLSSRVGTYLDLGVVEPSPDGRLLAYAVDRNGRRSSRSGSAT